MLPSSAVAPASEAELEELLSRPTRGVVGALAGLSGDLVLLGGGGKVGPTLARMARRALDETGNPHKVISVSRWSDAAAADRLRAEGIELVSADLSDPDAWAGLPEAALGVWCGVGWMIAVQAPVCFRSGYTKARFILLVLALAMFCVVMGGASILQFSVATQSGLPGWGLPALVLTTAAALVGSGALSIRWYRRRDL